MKFSTFAILTLFVGVLAHASVVPHDRYQEYLRLEAYKEKLVPRFKTLGLKGTESVHVLFSCPQDALDWAEKIRQRLAQETGAKKFDILPLTDRRYAVLQSYVHELWQAFTEIFPEETRNLNEPPVVLIDTEVVNAYVAQYMLEPNKIAHAIVVLTSLLDKAGGVENKDPITGVIGHELAHSVFKHLLPQFQKRINKFYVAENVRLGFQAEREAGLNKQMADYLENATAIGDLTYGEFLDLPSPGLSKPVFGRFWLQMRKELSAETPSCTTANQSLESWQKLVPASSFENAFSVLSKQLPFLADASARLIQDEKACYEGRKKGFVDLFAATLGMESSVLTSSPEVSELAKLFDGATDSIEGLRAITAPSRKEMVAVEKSLNMKTIGYFAMEEHADDISLLVHRHLKRNPEAIADFFKLFITKEDRERCDLVMKTGALPPLGAYTDPHRAPCYRINHLRDLAQYMDKVQAETSTFASDYVTKTCGKELR
jgi:hypothetical protein